MRKVNLIEKLKLILLTSVTSYATGAIIMLMLDPDNWQYGGSAGLVFTLGAWTHALFVDYRPRKPLQNYISASPRTVRVNGQNMMLSAAEWLTGKRQQIAGPYVWRVPYRDQVRPVTITETMLFGYAKAGWYRQLSGDPAPFARSKSSLAARFTYCCYTVLGYSGCFDSFGQGSRSKLVMHPERAIGACKRRFGRY